VGRLLSATVGIGLCLASAGASAATDLNLAVEFGYVDGGHYDGFLDRGLGKTAYGANVERLKLVDGYAEIRTDVGSRWEGKLTLTASEQLDTRLGVSEATLTYRPLPADGRRLRVKLGAFRPPVSFEHASEGWASKYTINASAINSWMGQEIGGLGAEVKLSSDPATSRGPLDWDVFAATFFGNDPSGTLLSWSGWSFWNGQTRWGDKIPLSDLPLFEIATYQAPRAEPYLETDNRPGFWLGGTLGQGNRIRGRYVYYDNRAEPNSHAQHQWGWRTRFHSVGVQANLPGRVGLISQYLNGSTYTWEVPLIGHVVDADFDSYFVMLTRPIGSNRVTLRYDHFEINDQDLAALDPNAEDGSAWTVSYHRRLGPHWRLAAEYVRIDSDRPARAAQGLPVRMLEHLGLVTLTWAL